MLDEVRLCRSCSLEKPLDEFRKRGPSAGKREGQPYGRCSECLSEYDAARFSTDDPAPYLIQLSHHRKKHSKHDWRINSSDIVGLWFKQDGKCAITGRPMTCIRGMGQVLTNASVDRIDSDKTYTTDNIQLVCNIVNLMKNRMTMDEMYDWCQAVLDYKDDR